jgi:hypothetical protein
LFKKHTILTFYDVYKNEEEEDEEEEVEMMRVINEHGKSIIFGDSL